MKTLCTFSCEKETILLIQDLNDYIILTHQKEPSKTITDTFGILSMGKALSKLNERIADAIDTKLY